jgi:outer membrane protein assembly factor BamB
MAFRHHPRSRTEKPADHRGLRKLHAHEEFPVDPQNNPAYKFAYPPLPWIGARFKFQVMEKDGNKVFGKSFDRLLFQRAPSSSPRRTLSNYTMQADVMTDGNARSKADIGLINQRYLICLRGNAGKLEVSSNLERLKQEVALQESPPTLGTPSKPASMSPRMAAGS